ncbi:uncharacterized protein LOC132202687 isoform X4 [Neocloeon triangulifer]|uniref:uncharacterized protein LOC132202687 isoform X4 n=1 Tax=Neocloeon triangulifer TaxID=2078957 RepID=UPI00286EE75A|nr:uncharacterized protein LOC132202687 isoform X4 [Neocloeon triangulifer]
MARKVEERKMGKITRGRTKYHTAAEQKQSIADAPSETQNVSRSLQTLSVPDDLFAGLDIPQAYLEPNKTLQDNLRRENEDARSTLSKKSFKIDNPYNKKEKRLLRREAFLMKLNAVRAGEIEEKKRKKRQKTVITGDMQDLFDSLPSVESQFSKSAKKPPAKERSIPKFNARSHIHNERVAKYKDAFLDFCTTSK